MKEKYWFRASKRGVGWVPVTWHGWWVCAFYLIALVYSFYQVVSLNHGMLAIISNFLPRFLTLSAILIIVTYLKGEPLTKKYSKEKDPQE